MYITVRTLSGIIVGLMVGPECRESTLTGLSGSCTPRSLKWKKITALLKG